MIKKEGQEYALLEKQIMEIQKKAGQISKAGKRGGDRTASIFIHLTSKEKEAIEKTAKACDMNTTELLLFLVEAFLCQKQEKTTVRLKTIQPPKDISWPP